MTSKLMENLIYKMIETEGADAFLTALNNASCHGSVFVNSEDHLLDNDDEFLNNWHKWLERMRKDVKKANKRANQ